MFREGEAIIIAVAAGVLHYENHTSAVTSIVPIYVPGDTGSTGQFILICIHLEMWELNLAKEIVLLSCEV